MAAGTTWKRLLLRLTGNPQAMELANADRNVLHENDGAFLGRFHKMNTSVRDHYLMGHYYKVMLVREPLERLISGYRDKMFRDAGYMSMRKRIKRIFRPNVSLRFNESCISLVKRYVYFGRFVKYRSSYRPRSILQFIYFRWKKYTVNFIILELEGVMFSLPEFWQRS